MYQVLYDSTMQVPLGQLLPGRGLTLARVYLQLQRDFHIPASTFPIYSSKNIADIIHRTKEEEGKRGRTYSGPIPGMSVRYFT